MWRCFFAFDHHVLPVLQPHSVHVHDLYTIPLCALEGGGGGGASLFRCFTSLVLLPGAAVAAWAACRFFLLGLPFFSLGVVGLCSGTSLPALPTLEG